VPPCRKPENHSDLFDSARVSEVTAEVGQVAAAKGAKERILRSGRLPYEDDDVSAKSRCLFGRLMTP
jgi:hypothetical protein